MDEGVSVDKSESESGRDVQVRELIEDRVPREQRSATALFNNHPHAHDDPQATATPQRLQTRPASDLPRLHDLSCDMLGHAVSFQINGFRLCNQKLRPRRGVP